MAKEYSYMFRTAAGVLGLGSGSASLLLLSIFVLEANTPFWFPIVAIPLVTMAYLTLTVAWQGKDPMWLRNLFDIPENDT